MDADAVVVGAGLAGLVATCELADAGRSVVLLDQESDANLGGQAWWSFGGLFLVDTPEQRRMGISDSFELAWQDWEGTAAWDRLVGPDGSPGPDHWGRTWARAYVEWAAGEKRAWLRELGVSFFPVVGWAERGDGTWGRHGRAWSGARAGRLPPGRRLEPGRHRRLRVRRDGGRRLLRGHRGRPRPRPRQLAATAGHTAGRPADRRPGIRRRTHADHHGAGGGAGRQP